MTTPYQQARALLLMQVRPLPSESVPLAQAAGRVLAEAQYARFDNPPFDRSPYDGYAFRARDTAHAPVTLRIIAECRAGDAPVCSLSAGTAVKILTGAPVPIGADAVVPFEKTQFTKKTVTVLHTAQPGENILRAGEDLHAGALLAQAGTVIDPGLAGTLASQGLASVPCRRVPRVGLICTGSELLEPGEAAVPGKIYDANRACLSAALTYAGCETVWLGRAGDDTAEIAEKIATGLAQCDAVLLTGGVSVGDYDKTPAAMAEAGAELLVHRADLKPGMACAYGVACGKLVLGLSGNPASALTNFYAVVLPALRRLAGRADAVPPEFPVTLDTPFPKKSPRPRLLRGMLDLSDGTARLRLPAGQGNAVLSSAIGCNCLAIIPAGSGPLPAGTVLKGFLI